MIKKSRATKKCVEISGRSYKNFDWENFSNEVRQIDLTESLAGCNPNAIWDNLHKEREGILDRLCPIRTIKLRTHSLPFINVELADQIYERDRAFRRARKSNLKLDWRYARELRIDVLMAAARGFGKR